MGCLILPRATSDRQLQRAVNGAIRSGSAWTCRGQARTGPRRPNGATTSGSGATNGRRRGDAAHGHTGPRRRETWKTGTKEQPLPPVGQPACRRHPHSPSRAQHRGRRGTAWADEMMDEGTSQKNPPDSSVARVWCVRAGCAVQRTIINKEN